MGSWSRSTHILRSSRHRLRARSRCHHTIDRLSRQAKKEEAVDDPPSMDRKGPLSIRPTFNYFKGNFGETASERRGGAYVGFPERVSTSLA